MFTFNNVSELIKRTLQDYVRNTPALGFFNLLTAPALYDTVESLLPKHRERPVHRGRRWTGHVRLLRGS